VGVQTRFAALAPTFAVSLDGFAAGLPVPAGLLGLYLRHFY
jgi:hypothetical protein